jgi:SAM-dependent methyltransferase
MNWQDFWDGEHSIYVNARHRMLHDRRIASDIADLVPSPAAVVLDYACGEATAADVVARRCGRLILSDAAPSVRAKLAGRYGRNAGIEILDPEAVQALPHASIDLIVVNSLLQYLSRAELDRLLAAFRPLLKPEGRLVIGDVIPRGRSPLADAASLLRFGWEGGFLIASALGLAKTFFSDYRKLRAELGLSFHDAHEMLAILDHAGFEARRLPVNIGHNQGRMTFEAKRA